VSQEEMMHFPNLILDTKPQEENSEISKAPTEEKTWAKEMPLGENHILILLKEEAIQDTKIQVIHLVM
jgi:hypothetical protein